MKQTWILASLLASGCGDSQTTPSDSMVGSDGSPGDGRDGPLDDCGTLAPTCGPTGMSPCCTSSLVPGGTFYRSYDVSGDGMFPNTSYPATVSTFRLDTYEVTVGRFREFVMGGHGTQTNPPAAGSGARNLNGSANQGGWIAGWSSSLLPDTTTLLEAIRACNTVFGTWMDTPGANENRPMNCISWYEAMAFCIWDGGFLPSEAEWNYAAAGGDEQRAYPWSSPASSLDIDGTRASYNNGTDCVGDGMPGCALTDVAPVGSKPAGDGRWGHSDLAGNVWEWVLDWHDTPYSNPCTDCAHLTVEVFRVLRGGFYNSPASHVRSANRGADSPANRFANYGVRCGRAP